MELTCWQKVGSSSSSLSHVLKRACQGTRTAMAGQLISCSKKEYHDSGRLPSSRRCDQVFLTGGFMLHYDLGLAS